MDETKTDKRGTKPAEPETPPRVGRDVRVDHIGFAKELHEKWATPLRADVKRDVQDKQLDAVEGDFFRGELRGGGGSIRTINPAKFFKLIKSGRITEKEFISCISVERGLAKELLGDRDLDHISDTEQIGPSFWVFRIKGVEKKLVDELKSLGDALK